MCLGFRAVYVLYIIMSFQCCVWCAWVLWPLVVCVCMENIAHWVCLCPSALSPRCRWTGEVDPRLRGNYPPSHPPTPGMKPRTCLSMSVNVCLFICVSKTSTQVTRRGNLIFIYPFILIPMSAAHVSFSCSLSKRAIFVKPGGFVLIDHSVFRRKWETHN